MLKMHDNNNSTNNNKKVHHFEEKSNTKHSDICTRKCNYTEIRADLGDYKWSIVYVNKTWNRNKIIRMEVICRSNKINSNDNIWKELNICSPNGTPHD